MRRLLATCIAFLLAGSAFGECVRYFPVPHRPVALTSGPDGRVWFVSFDASSGVAVGYVGHIDPDGSLTETVIPERAQPQAITTGPDGRLWIADIQLGVIRTYDLNGHFQTFPVELGSEPYSITTASDGNIWFTTQASFFGRMTIGGVLSRISGVPAFSITSDSAGDLWIGALDRLIRLDPRTLLSTEFTVPAYGVAASPDGSIWFTVRVGSPRVGRLTPATGAVTYFTLPPQSPSALLHSIAASSDGSIWFTGETASGTPGFLGRVTPQGSLTSIALTPAYDGPQNIIVGPDNAIWVAIASKVVARVYPCRRRAARH